MRSDGVVVVAPTLDYDVGLLETVEDFSVEKLILQFAVERLAIAVLPGTSGFDVERFGSDVSKPLAHDLGRHLRAIVGSDGRLLNTKEAAFLLGVSARTCEDWRLRGGGPDFVKLGARLIRYQRSALLRFAGRDARRKVMQRESPRALVLNPSGG